MTVAGSSRIWISLSCLLIAGAASAQKSPGPSPDPNRYKHDYAFGADWFWPSIPNWEKHLAHLKGRPNLNYLEVGPFEGRSFFWLLDNILTDPSTKATAIDVFEKGTSTHYQGKFEKRFRKNARISGRNDSITIIKGYSQEELRPLPLDSFDVIYIDGSHAASDVLADMTLSWGLLKTGGIMILDDYRWNAGWPYALRPAFAINSFISAFAKEIEIIQRGSGVDQVFLRKQPNRCLQIHYEGCSYLGPYLYDWRENRTLYKADGKTRVPLSEREKRIVEKLLRSKGLGEVDYSIDKKMKNDPDFQKLNRRLGLDSE